MDHFHLQDGALTCEGVSLEVIAAAANMAQFILYADINDEGSRWDEMAGGD